jgi:hypothetical protein
MPSADKKKTGKNSDPGKIARLTIRLDEKTASLFKIIAAIRRMKLEDLGIEAVNTIIEKHKQVLRDLSEKF